MIQIFPGHQTTNEEVLSEPWFLALLGSVVLTVLILIFVGIILYRKQWSRQKGLGQLSLPGSQHYEDMTRLQGSNGTGNTIWVNGGWKEKLQEQQHSSFMTSAVSSNQPADQALYAEVGDANSNKSHLMSTFGTTPSGGGGNFRLGPDPAPYATTTLAMQNRIRTMVSFDLCVI